MSRGGSDTQQALGRFSLNSALSTLKPERTKGFRTQSTEIWIYEVRDDSLKERDLPVIGEFDSCQNASGIFLIFEHQSPDTQATTHTLQAFHAVGVSGDICCLPSFRITCSLYPQPEDPEPSSPSSHPCLLLLR